MNHTTVRFTHLTAFGPMGGTERELSDEKAEKPDA